MENNYIKEDYKNLQNFVENEISNINLIKEIMKIFLKDISIIKEDILTTPEIQNGPFYFLNQLLKNLVSNIKNNIVELNDFINSIDNLINSFKFAADKKINIINEIESNLLESKNNFINKKIEYLNLIKESEKKEKNEKKIFFTKKKENINNKEISSKKDENIFKSSMKENYNLLYQYEINKMKEIIEENKTKYNDIFKEIGAISTSLKLSIKDCLIKFSKNITNFSEFFNVLSKDLMTNVGSINNEENIPLKAKFTFSFEELSINEKLEDKEINNEKRKLFNFFNKRKTVTLFSKINLNNNKSDILSRYDSEKGFEDKIEKFNKEFMDNIIKTLVGENELKSKDFIDLCNILAINKSKQDNIYADIFLNKIKKYYKHRVITLKNKNNFIHLSNIMNILCLNYKTNNNILMLIIEVSQMIKYKSEYVYKIIQRKNEFFSTKTLWQQLIDYDLINDLNEFVDDLINNNERKSIKEDKEDKKIYELLDLNKKIVNYKKLNNSQKKELVQYGKKKICNILSKSILGMCCFLVPEKVINEIIVFYGIQFKFEYELKCYLKNIMLIKNIKIRNNIKYCPDKEEITNNKIICISSIAKFYQIKDYSLFLRLNKELYPNLRKNIFLNLLSDEKLSINSHLLLWKEYLKIEKFKKEFKYKDIKELIYISPDKDTINEELGESKNINVIEKDLLRTKFISQNKDKLKILKTILISFLFLFPKIGYCQGMHYIVSFLYQILDYNEEETFYYFCGFELNTKYHEIFEDDFNTLKTYCNVFEKILNINWPEIHYKFIDCHILPNLYLFSWFITIFSDYAYIFDKNNLPKFSFFIFEKFIIEGWSVIFNIGFTILEYCQYKLLSLDKDKLMFYIMNILDKEDIIKNENFETIKRLYMKNSKFINEFSINTLIEITKYEEKNKNLNENIDLMGKY